MEVGGKHLTVDNKKSDGLKVGTQYKRKEF